MMLCCSHQAYASASTDGTYTLRLSTFNTISSKTTGTNHQVTGTFGQPVAGQDFQSSSYSLDIGFWYCHLLPVIAGDLNDNGLIDLDDVITGLRVLTRLSSVTYNEADVDGNGQLGAAELIYIMRKISQDIE